MNTCIVPVDFSDATAPLVEFACQFTKEHSIHVVLVHVAEPIIAPVPSMAATEAFYGTAEVTAPLPIDERAERHQLDKLRREFEHAGVSCESHLLLGLAVDEIVQIAAEKKADLIIMASHGRGALYHLFAGSAVTGVLKHTPCPVLVVPVKKK